MAKAKTPTVGPLPTPEGRLSFPHLAAPETTGQFPSNKYVGTLLIPKTADLSSLTAACLQAAQAMWPNANITTLGQIKLPFRDGDEKAQMPGMAGNIYVKCKSTYKPAIVGPQKVGTSFPEYTGPVKAGDFVRFSVTAFPYPMNYTVEVAQALRASGKLILEGTNEQGVRTYFRPAVTLMLNAVQFLREGPAMGGGAGGAAAFDDGDAPAGGADDGLFG